MVIPVLLELKARWRVTLTQENEVVMHRIVVIVFDNETKAEEGKTELLRLDSDGSISIYGYAVVGKKADGTVVVKQADGRGTLSPFANSLLRRLCDAAYSVLQSAATQTGDPATNSNRAKTGEDFIRDMTQVLLPNRVAIVAEVEEEWPSVLDHSMESIGGVIFRWTESEVQHAIELEHGGLRRNGTS
jgi:uncharacterized membrane protein